MVGCSVVIRCYNEGRHIGRLLEGLTKQTIKDIEIIVVDSGSKDNTLDVVSSYKHKLVYIPPERFSFGRALNMGCAAATKPYLVFASAHTYPVYVDWLERLLDPFKDPQVALAYGCQRGPPTAPFSEQRIFEQWFPEDAPTIQNHPFCNNANAAVRRDLWEKFPYNEDLTGLEDLDWAKRVIESGYSIRYVSRARIIHVHEETSRQTYRRYFREAIAMRAIYPGHRFTTWDLLTLTPQAILKDYAAAVREKKLLRNLIDIPRFRALQMAGAFRGARFTHGMTSDLRRRFYYPDRSRAAFEELKEMHAPQEKVEYEHPL